MNRRHLLFCVAVCLVTAVCFAIPIFFLFFGILYLPLLVATLIRVPSSAATFLPPVALTVFGTAGIAGVVRVVVLVCRRRQHDPRRGLTFAALACGAVAALLFAAAVSTHWGRSSLFAAVTVVCLPLAWTLLLVYLARRPLLSIGREP